MTLSIHFCSFCGSSHPSAIHVHAHEQKEHPEEYKARIKAALAIVVGDAKGDAETLEQMLKDWKVS